MSKRKYPYQNLSLQSIKGEKWKDAPGYDGSYQISSLGRVKSLKRWRNVGRNSGYYTQERIRKPGLSCSTNTHTGSPSYSLGISLKQNGSNYSTSIARLVYYCFVGEFDLQSRDLIISYKDLDGRNLRPSNLLLSTRSKVQERIYRTGRGHSHWQDQKLAVLQLTMQGKLLFRYESLTKAHQKTGFSLSAIRECALGHISQHKGYRWQLEKESAAKSEKVGAKPVFNKGLWEKLSRPKTSKKDPIAALNLSLASLKGEQWKLIQGLKGNYFVSNLGRVRSDARFKTNGVWLKTHIQKLICDGKAARKPSTLLVTIKEDGKKRQLSVARLVYYHFVKKFELRDKSKKVHYKDRCLYNLKPGNLVLR